MSTTVEVYIADSGDPVSLAQRVAVALEVPAYFSPGEIFIFSLDAQRWIGAKGIGSLTLDRTEYEPEDQDEIAFAPYKYELSLEFKSGPALARGELRERFGHAVFQQLTTLDCPLALGDNSKIYADFLPGRGERDFGTGVSFTESGRDQWYEPRLYKARTTPEPPDVAAGQVTVFETGGLLHFVPKSGTKEPVTPIVSVHSTVGAPILGRILAEALGRSGAQGDGDPFPSIYGAVQMTADEYAQAAISIDVKAERDVVTALPHESYTGDPVGRVVQGAGVEPLATRETGPWNDEAMGGIILRLVAAIRDHAYA